MLCLSGETLGLSAYVKVGGVYETLESCKGHMVDHMPAKKSVSWYHKVFVLLSGVGKFGPAEGRRLRVTSALPLPSLSTLSKCQAK